MKLTTKGRYAVTAMLDLALYGQDKSVVLTDVARRQEISPSYLGQLFAQLCKHGLVQSQRGPGGGYKLAKSSEDISVADVIMAVNENVDSTQCGGKANCQSGQRCLAHGLWESLSHRIYSFLDNTSLAKVVAEHDVLEVAKRQALSFERDHGVPLQFQEEHFSGVGT